MAEKKQQMPSIGENVCSDVNNSQTAPSMTTTIDDKQWENLSENLQYLWCNGGNQIDILPNPPTSFIFLRDYVSKSPPCIIKNVFMDDKDSVNPKTLTLDDIIEMRQQTCAATDDDRLITVDVTPDGQGDCVRTCRRVSSRNTKTRFKNDASSQGSGGMIHSTPSSPHDDGDDDDEEEEELFIQPKQFRMSLDEFRRRLRRQAHQTTNNDYERKKTDLDIHGRPVLVLQVPTGGDDEKDKPSSEKKDRSLPPDDSVVYYSKQNDCLRHEFPELMSLFPLENLHWAWEAFGGSESSQQSLLDAINLWIGNGAAISSMHKDHYENLFYVASGEKIFTLCPPACVPFLYEHLEYPNAAFEQHQNKIFGDDSDKNAPTKEHQWNIRRIFEETEEGSSPFLTLKKQQHVRWVAPDVTCLTAPTSIEQKKRILTRYPLLKHVHPIEVKVQTGDMLYLPSLWFHRVTQSCETVGVNYWYEMHFDSPLWCYYSLLSQLQHPKPTTNQY